MSNFLTVKDLVVRYDTDDAVVRALNGVSFSMAEGETLGLVGETGAGKTTAALSILRLLPDPPGKIVGGDIRFQGESLSLIHIYRRPVLEAGHQAGRPGRHCGGYGSRALYPVC